MAKYTSEEHNVINHNGRNIPTDTRNKYYRQLLEDGVVVEDYVAPPTPPVVKSKVDKVVDKMVQKGLITQEEADAFGV